MAELALIYGLRLLPADDLEAVGHATVELKEGKKARVAMHLLQGDKESIKEQLSKSVEAFFDIYPEI
jgi:hypothetical protein